ncbi:trypsin-like serine protease [Streptosporangium sp. NPDC048865]|uniref:trypsin-like serine protease n=1 Tax=Streptosporangium sp. NPDC048865 TaxID=3155766 RepID=UPI003425EA05
MISAALTATTVFPASPALAITNGSPDLAAHPQVGAVIGDKPNGDGTWSYCTGTLISPTVFLTAAHCVEDGRKTARVSFSSSYRDGDKIYTGRYVVDSRYEDKSDLHDMAVVVFDTAVPDIKPARLPAEGLLDRLDAANALKITRFTPVGYGAVASAKVPAKGKHASAKGKHGVRLTYNDTRHQATISFKDLTRRWLKLSLTSKGDGSTCFGDSGGPNFLGGPTSDLLVATTISGDDDACKLTNYDYRLDTPQARAFLKKFVTLP